MGSSGRTTNSSKEPHSRRGTYGTPSDDGVPRVPLKSRYGRYRDFSSVQLFATISGTFPLLPLSAWKFSSAALGLLMHDSKQIHSRPQPIIDNLCISCGYTQGKGKWQLTFGLVKRVEGSNVPEIPQKAEHYVSQQWRRRQRLYRSAVMWRRPKNHFARAHLLYEQNVRLFERVSASSAFCDMFFANGMSK